MDTDKDKDTELQELWNEAVEKYASGSKRGGEVLEKWKKSVSSSADLDELIHASESGFKTYRTGEGGPRRQKLWKIFRTTMIQLEHLGDVVKAGVGLTPFAPAAILVQAGLVLIKAGSAVSGAYDALERLFERIHNIADCVDEYCRDKSLKTADNRSLRRVVVQLLAGTLGVFCEAEEVVRRGRAHELMNRALGRKNRIQTALDELDRQVKAETELVTAKVYAAMQRLRVKTEADQHRELLQQSLHSQWARDNKAYHLSIESERLPNSGEWMRQQPLFEKWRQGDFPVLCLLGPPGTGKTFVASQVVSTLQSEAKKSRDMLLAYFYIREGMSSQHTPSVILRALASQITEKDSAYCMHAIQACRDENNLLLPTTIWESLFMQPFRLGDKKETSQTLYLVIDGMDEATITSQEQLLQLAKTLTDAKAQSQGDDSPSSPLIQLLLVGRPGIAYRLSSVWNDDKGQPPILCMDPSLTKGDMDEFIQQAVNGNTMPLLRKMMKEEARRFRRTIIQALRANADGMFMLVKLMVAEIQHMNKPELVRRALNKPPRGLDDMFRRVISQLVAVGGFDKDDFNEIILWVACAQRDLYLWELDLVLKVRDLDQGGIVGLDEELRTRFGSFFSLFGLDGAKEDDDDDDEDEEDDEEDEEDEVEEDKDDADTDDDDSFNGGIDGRVPFPRRFLTTIVKFSHASVGQYFRDASLHEGIGMDTNDAHAHIAITCLLCLNKYDDELLRTVWAFRDLYVYASRYLLDHLEKIDLVALDPGRRSRLANELASLMRGQNCLIQWYTRAFHYPRLMCQLFSERTCACLLACMASADEDEAREAGQAENSFDSTAVSSGTPWLLEAKTSIKVLLAPFAQGVAQEWLRNSGSGIHAIVFLSGYKAVCHATPWTLLPDRPLQQYAQRLSPAEIRDLATIFPTSTPDAWHWSLAVTLDSISTTCHQLAAVEQYRLFREKSDDPHTKSRACVKEMDILHSLGLYQEIITTGEHFLSIETDRSVRDIVFSTMQRAQLELIGVPASTSTMAPHEQMSIYATVMVAHRTCNPQKVVHMLRALLSRDHSSDRDLIFQGPFLLTGRTAEYIMHACAQTGELDLAEDLYTRMTQLSSDHDEACRQLASDLCSRSREILARICYRYRQDESRACDMWERLVREESAGPGHAMNDHRTKAASIATLQLALIYFTKMVLAGETCDTRETIVWMEKLRGLVGCWDKSMVRNVRWTTRAVWRQWEPDKGPDLEMRFPSEVPKEVISALLGQWLTRHGMIDLARAAALPLLRQALASLFDNDTSNDYTGFANLGQALFCAGDRDKAVIAYMLADPLEIRKRLVGAEETETEEAQKAAAPVCLVDACNGFCQRRKSDVQTYSVCTVCVKTGFCDECLARLRVGSLPFRICDPSHHFLEIYPTRGRVSQGDDGLRVNLQDGNVMDVYDWLDLIRKEWKI